MGLGIMVEEICEHNEREIGKMLDRNLYREKRKERESNTIKNMIPILQNYEKRLNKMESEIKKLSNQKRNNLQITVNVNCKHTDELEEKIDRALQSAIKYF